ncbi:MAG: TIGR00269 family protein [Candidatus Woesearchaeota archaeon]|jgi:uncharacterized protein (TIGR00269 family)|nr:TIGR00269 family protein [Candidatus Woesearchaeota archaeon]MDP7622868.1 TIGR00269 family protein [Candidatus Woesearchaeota archaeon]HJN56872.1 TIGR00269 family protein [Candidatus Woesearchaeota archaeon]|tara:strand:+ start:19645 stop:20574 length:930 start_codon:yes stop_codon:yes gene_type:complete
MKKNNCCSKNPVIKLPAGERLCKSHFTKYFEGKVFRTIRQFNLIGKKERIVAALSGGKDSLTLLHILNKLSKQNPRIKVEAITIDEGIKGYREKTLKTAKKFCKKNKIKLNLFSFKKEFGLKLDNMIDVLNEKPCTVCGILRRYLLNKKSKELGFTKLATGHNLDDECQSIMMNQFKNNMQASARLGPISGVNKNKKFVPRIKPLYLCTEKETAIYAYSNNLLDNFTECPNITESYRAEIRNMLNDFEQKFPGTKHSIINSFLQILPELKSGFKEQGLNYCNICQEPASKGKCNACRLLDKIKKSKIDV